MKQYRISEIPVYRSDSRWIYWALLAPMLWGATHAFGNTSAASVAIPCTAPLVQSQAAPPGLRINDELLESALSSIMDTDSRPLRIDYAPEGFAEPLRINLADPHDNGYLVKVSDTRWHYWPGVQPVVPEIHTATADSIGHPSLGQKVSLIDICAGDFHSRIQIWPTQYLPKLSKRYPTPYESPLPHRYDTPINFIQVNTPEEASLQLSPRFTLRQFLPPADSVAAGKWPQPALVRMPLLEKLESVLTVLAEHGKPTATLTILSGYRTPAHNRWVGGAAYSRHMYGDAADFIVDANNDGKMDDLNGDGKVSRADLKWLLDRLARRPVPVTAGGTGAYESHGEAEAFLHIDARGRAFYWQ